MEPARHHRYQPGRGRAPRNACAHLGALSVAVAVLAAVLCAAAAVRWLRRGWRGPPVRLPRRADLLPGRQTLNPLRAFSGSELVYSETLGDWRTHNGADYACEQGSGVQAVQGGTVEAVEQDALWGGVVTVAADENGVRWRYCGLQNIAVAAGDTVARGDILGTLGPIPSESRDPQPPAP